MICEQCVVFDSLKELITKNGKTDECKYCYSQTTCLDENAVFSYIESRLVEVLTSTEHLSAYEHGMIYECGSDEPKIYPIWEFLGDSNEIAREEVIDSLMAYLPKEFHVNDQGQDEHFVFDDGTLEQNDYADQWQKFVEDIHHDRRFFNKSAKEFLDSLFTTLNNGENLDVNSVTELPSSAPLFRSRIANGEESMKKISKNPCSELGPVPKNLAGNQRMTPAGISAIYCSLDRNTCLCELRTIVGDIAISGAFQSVNGLKLIDLKKLSEACKIHLDKLDLLHEGYRNISHAYEFLKDITYKLSRPLGRQDELGYLSTQVFFEYLRVKYSDTVDGVIFESIQNDGKGTNLALFPESSSVSNLKEALEEGATPKASDLKHSNAKLYFVNDSIVYHKINAVEVKSKDSKWSEPFVVDELTRRRFYAF
jgi:hypothetical protein